MKQISRRHFLAMSCCAAGAASCPAIFASAASAAAPASPDLNSAQVSRLFAAFGEDRRMPEELNRWLNDPARQKQAPYRAFDNVWQVGIAWVSSWAVNTGDGWVLIDTTHEPFVGMLIDNLRAVGVPLDQIRYVLMTHGHFDHAGGAVRLKPLLKNARFAMTERGWNEAFRYARESDKTPNRWTMLDDKDLVLSDGQRLICGDNAFIALETPGHTWGTASYLYDARHGGKSYRAVTVGGQGLNAIDGPEQVRAYIRSMNRLSDDALNVQVDLTAHPFSTGLTEKIPAIRAVKASDPHPLVDRAAYLARLAGLNDRAEARLQKELAKAAG